MARFLLDKPAPGKPWDWSKMPKATLPEVETTLARRKLLAPARSAKLLKGPVKVAFLDADDTIRYSTNRAYSKAPNHPDHVAIYDGVAERIRKLNEQGYFVAIASNQGGAYRTVTMEDADASMLRTVELLREQGAEIDYYDFAEFFDADRKPEAGMAKRLEAFIASESQGQAHIDWQNSFMVGNAGWTKDQQKPDGSPGTDFHDADRMFAETVGIPFHHAEDYFGVPRAEE